MRRSNASRSIRLYLIDDQAMLRAALRSLLHARGGLEVVGDSGDVFRAIGEIRRLKPDVVVLDPSLPGLNGTEALNVIHQACPRTPLVVTTHHECPSAALRSFAAGARGFVCKEVEIRDLVLAIEAACGAESFLSPRLAR